MKRDYRGDSDRWNDKAWKDSGKGGSFSAIGQGSGISACRYKFTARNAMSRCLSMASDISMALVDTAIASFDKVVSLLISKACQPMVNAIAAITASMAQIVASAFFISPSLRLAILIATAIGGSLSHAQPVWVTGVATTATNTPGWNPNAISYFNTLTAIQYQFNTNVAAGVGTNLSIPLYAEIPAGTYSFWIGLVNLLGTQNLTNNSIAFTAGTGSGALEFTNNLVFPWRRVANFTSDTAFTNVVLTFIKMTPAGENLTLNRQNYYFGGIGIVSTNSDLAAPVDTYFADYSQLATNTSYAAGNLLVNSSFELDMAGGWTFTRQANPANATWLKDAIDGSTAAHGSKSVLIDNQTHAFFEFQSPAIWVRGDKVGNYTLSFYAKGDGAQLTVQVGSSLGMTNSYVTTPNVLIDWDLTPAASWVRYSTNFYFDPRPGRLMYVDFSQPSTTLEISLDGLQVEEGPLTAYAPARSIEHTVTAGRNGNVFTTNEARTLAVNFYNNGASAAVTFNYEVYDWMNRRLTTGSSNWTVAAGASATNWTVTTTNNGSTRVVSWLSESALRDECVFTVAPITAFSGTLETNSFFGIHGNLQTAQATSNAAWGLSWTRSLSPGLLFRQTVIEVISNVFTWASTDAKVNAVAGNQIILGSLQETFPAHMLTNNYPRLDRYSNYVWQVVNRYKGQIKYWETRNEPNRTGSTGWTNTQYAPILEQEVLAVKAADPNAFFVAFALGVFDGAFLTNEWNALSADAKSKIDAISCHLYPNPTGNWNATDELSNEGTRNETAMTWGAFTGKPVWMTEGGRWQIGLRRSDVVGGKFFHTPIFPHAAEEGFRRGTYQETERCMRQFLDAVGNGFDKFFYYDARQTDVNLRLGDDQPSIYHVGYDSLTTMGASYIWAKYFVDHPASRQVVSNNNCIGYLFARTNQMTLAVYSLNRSNYHAEVTNSNFTPFDLHGNPVDFKIGRTPFYWVSTTMTSNEMANTFTYATITHTNDTVAPALSIDVTPHGTINSNSLPLRLRWSAIDETKICTDDTPTNVMTRYRVNGQGNWTSYSGTRAIVIPSISPGTYSLSVQAKDADGNESEVVIGPEWIVTGEFVPQPRRPAVIHRGPQRLKGRTILR